MENKSTAELIEELRSLTHSLNNSGVFHDYYGYILSNDEEQQERIAELEKRASVAELALKNYVDDTYFLSRDNDDVVKEYLEQAEAEYEQKAEGGEGDE